MKYPREFEVGIIDGDDTEIGQELSNLLILALAEAKKERPDLFEVDSPFAELTKDDEDMDALLMSGKFEINAGLVSYYREIKRYKVDELLNKIGIGTKGLFEILNGLCGVIKDNTDKPIYAQNKITDVIKTFDNYPGCGQVVQILILQGVVAWFENCDINEGDRGYSDAQSLCEWVYWRLIEVSTFYFIHFNKNENSKPLDDYLATLDVGKAWESVKNPQNDEQKENQRNEKDVIAEEDKSPYSAMEWATIFYYADGKNLVSNGKTLKSRLEAFRTKHNLSTTFKSLVSKYHNAHKRIIETSDYPIEKLNSIIPFLNNNYPTVVTQVEEDIKFLQDEITEREQGMH